MKSSQSGGGTRSLVCNENGIVMAEMVYRCLTCAQIFDSVELVQTHYVLEHFEEEANSNCSGAFDNQVEIDYDNDDFDSSEHLNDISEENDSEEEDMFVSVQTESLMPQDIECNESSKSTLNVKGGFVTCEVCGVRKFYSHISRRYGVFSCESCAKFFYRYNQKPMSYTCSSNGNCSLNIDMHGGRCKSCLLKACQDKYILDPKKHPKMFRDSQSNGISLKNSIPSASNADKVIRSGSSLQTWVGSSKANESLFHEDVSSYHSTGNVELSTSHKTSKAEKALMLRGNLVKPGSKRPTCHQQSKYRRAGCGVCQACLAQDCGRCLYCLDKPKFGGSDIKKQKCLKRRCGRK